MFGLNGYIKTFSKVPGVSLNVSPYMAYVLYIRFFIILYTKKGGLGVQNAVFMHIQLFLAILVIKMAEFPKKKASQQSCS